MMTPIKSWVHLLGLCRIWSSRLGAEAAVFTQSFLMAVTSYAISQVEPHEILHAGPVLHNNCTLHFGLPHLVQAE